MKLNLRSWHRRLGIFSAFVLCWLALSGLLLNHSHDLALDNKNIENQLINKLYGFQASNKEVYAIKVGNDFYYCTSGRLIKNKDLIADCLDELKSVVMFQEKIIVLSDASLFILSEQGKLLEKISLSLFSVVPESLWVFDRSLFFIIENKAKLLDINTLELRQFPQSNEVMRAYKRADRQAELLPKSLVSDSEFSGISLERVLLDAHSGRIFGSWGVYIIDFFALSFFVLAFSGLLIYLKRK